MESLTLARRMACWHWPDDAYFHVPIRRSLWSFSISVWNGQSLNHQRFSQSISHSCGSLWSQGISHLSLSRWHFVFELWIPFSYTRILVSPFHVLGSLTCDHHGEMSSSTSDLHPGSFSYGSGNGVSSRGEDSSVSDLGSFLQSRPMQVSWILVRSRGSYDVYVLCNLWGSVVHQTNKTVFLY